MSGYRLNEAESRPGRIVLVRRVNALFILLGGTVVLGAALLLLGATGLAHGLSPAAIVFVGLGAALTAGGAVLLASVRAHLPERMIFDDPSGRVVLESGTRRACLPYATIEGFELLEAAGSPPVWRATLLRSDGGLWTLSEERSREVAAGLIEALGARVDRTKGKGGAVPSEPLPASITVERGAETVRIHVRRGRPWSHLGAALSMLGMAAVIAAAWRGVGAGTAIAACVFLLALVAALLGAARRRGATLEVEVSSHGMKLRDSGVAEWRSVSRPEHAVLNFEPGRDRGVLVLPSERQAVFMLAARSRPGDTRPIASFAPELASIERVDVSGLSTIEQLALEGALRDALSETRMRE